MEKTSLIEMYLEKGSIRQDLIPVDVYFIKDRIKKPKEEIVEKSADQIKVKPNYLNKIGYSGKEHNLPAGCISQIIDLEKLL